jgi:MFS family permease
MTEEDQMSQNEVQPAEYQFSRRQIIWGLVAVFAVYGTMSFIVQTGTIARPKIAADLNGMSLYAWSVSIPGLVGVLVTLIFGKFSDMYGRRVMLMISLIASFVGTILSALSPNFIFLIVVTSVAFLGAGAMMPLVFAVIGDLFPPSERSKWVGLLNIPVGICALIGPTLGGFVVDTLNWRYLYWMAVPLLAICLITVPIGVPSLMNRDSSRKIDVKGCIFLALASSTTIFGFSFAGTTYPWLSAPIIGLLGFSLACWIIFLRVESGAKEPVLDLIVLRNRSFLTVAVALFFSFFGLMGMMMYFPMFLQGVQGISTMRSGQIITPNGLLMGFIGVPVGYIIAKRNIIKQLYVIGYAIGTLIMFGMIFFNADTPIVFSIAVSILAGLGMGAIPTINTVVVQNAVPKRLMGAAMGAFFFFFNMGMTICPAILGSAMNITYAKAISQSLPEGMRGIADEKIMDALDDPRVLLSESAMEDLEKAIRGMGDNGQQLFQQTVEAIRHSLVSGLRSMFLISAITMLFAFLLICTLPSNPVANDE